MFFLTPRYLKHAKMLHKGVTRFIDYKRDLLPPAKLEEICDLRRSLEGAMKARDRTRLAELNEQINKVCERALPEAAPSEIGDNVEVFFVAIVIALGIRGYIAQPFQIPTGSMQPTLNGITAQATAEDPRPGWLGYLGSFLTSTRHIHVVSDHTGYLRDQDPVTEHKFLIFLPYSKLHFRDGHEIKIMAPKSQLTNQLHLGRNIQSTLKAGATDTPDRQTDYDIAGGEYIKEGQLLASGIVNNGDHVLVDKFSYHFRTPTRGEVFVFTTKHINSIAVPAEQGSQHYIKRLAGVPGDYLETRLPAGEELWEERPEFWKREKYQYPQRLYGELWHNGVKAQEPGFQKVMSGKDGYNGYTLINGRTMKVKLEDRNGEGTYYAMGDNSANSSDSRYWGPVPERNLVGPALFCYWPLTKHWGRIK
ncbi:signal peptidase I [Prosthecobacter fusiformis]|uniref:Signal peptidase I n=1 Tax=Prosthecobacter fusiformis TaxID=48464 RepID=A0A4R7RUD2_9BACT|nr:signal peptidase I [Prosthecobacter fusiformis]TDU69261.1 signal peptidase I [Prosthecobacter fusiformis]